MERPPVLSPETVQTFVGSAHGDLERVRAMLEQEPALANACWDWGGGDFETGIGAAAHMGRRDIAELLLAHGARLDLFAAAMLGQIGIVKAVLDAYPAMLQSRGAHGIPLLAHAQVGGPNAVEVVAFLESRG